MTIETALKSYSLEIILDESKSSCFNEIFHVLLTEYKSFHVGSNDYVKALKRRLSIRDTINNTLTRYYTFDKRVIKHFYHKDTNVPIWAIFEVLSLGDFGKFISCLGESTRKNISKNLGLNISCDPNGKLTSSIIYAIKDLRNAIAHNEIIFDARFKSGSIGNPLIRCVGLSTSVSGINFNSVVDYIVLITYLLKILSISKLEIQRFVNDFESCCEHLRKLIPINMYNQIIPTDTNRKVTALKIYAKK